jgi:DNA-binding beta-propeller fold protein YncE
MNKNLIPELFIAILLSSVFFTLVISAAPATVTTAFAKTISISTEASSSTPTSSVDNNTSCTNSKVRTSGGTLDVFLHSRPEPIVTHNQIIFQAFFLQKGQTDNIQQHVDYDFVITKAGGKQVFQASAIAGAPSQPLHSAEGVANIPYEFQTPGDYSVNVTVYGILFNPIKPESALFRIKVLSGQGPLNSITAITANTINNSTMKNQSTRQQLHYSFVKEWGIIGGYQFKDPTGLATDAAGNVYVADMKASTVIKFTSDGKFITKWGTPGNNGSQFHFPTAVATDPLGKVYVTDFSILSNGTIQKFTSDGKFITKWGSSGVGDGQFNYTRGIATDSLGNVYVADSGNHRIQKFDSNGNFITKWGPLGGCDWQLDYPAGIVVDHLGRVYVSDLGDNLILKFTSDGKFITKWGSSGVGDGRFNYTRGIATDSLGNVYVVDSGNNRIQKFDSNGNFITKWGSPGAGDGKFKFADSIAVNPSGNKVYVTDSDNRSIKVFALTSNSTN